MQLYFKWLIAPLLGILESPALRAENLKFQFHLLTVEQKSSKKLRKSNYAYFKWLL